MGQDIKEIPSLFIHNYKLEVIHEFVYLGSTITDNLSIDSELNKQIALRECISLVSQPFPAPLYLSPCPAMWFPEYV